MAAEGPVAAAAREKVAAAVTEKVAAGSLVDAMRLLDLLSGGAPRRHCLARRSVKEAKT